MDDDDDYFVPTNSSRRLAMLFTEDVTTTTTTSGGGGSGSIMSHKADPSPNFKFVAPKQPRPGRSNSSASASSGGGGGRSSSRDGQEVLLDVVLSVLLQGTERSVGGKTTPVKVQVVGNAVKRTFILLVLLDKEHLWRVPIDSHLLLQVVECCTVRLTANTKSMTLTGEAQRIEHLVTQLAIYRAVCSSSSGPTWQDLCVGEGHVLSEGDVAKVHCTNYTITSAGLRGEQIVSLTGVKVSVSPSLDGGWESCLAGTTVDSQRLIFLPKQLDGKWLPPTTFYHVTVLKVRTKGGKDKPPPPSLPTTPPPPPSSSSSVAAVVSNKNSPTKIQQQQQQEQQMDTSHDASALAASQSVTSQNGDTGEAVNHHHHHHHHTPEDGCEGSKKAALVSRMAQLGTALFPLLPTTTKGPLPHSSQTVGVECQEVSTPPSITHTSSSSCSSSFSSSCSSTTASNSTSIPASTPVTTSSSTPGLSCASTTTTTTPAPAPVSVPVPTLPPLDSTLPLTPGHLGTALARISDRLDLLLTKVDNEKAGYSHGSSSSPASDPEALLTLAQGIVAHNERLTAQVELLEKKLSDTQNTCTSLLTMNTELLQDKREMLRQAAEQTKEEQDKDKKEDYNEELKDQKEPVKEGEEKQTQTEDEVDQSERLAAGQVRLMMKATLSGLFRHLSTAFTHDHHYTRPQVLRSVKSGLELAYSSLLENLEHMGGGEEEEEGRGGEEEEGRGKEEEEEYQHEENEERHQPVEMKEGENDPGEESD